MAPELRSIVLFVLGVSFMTFVALFGQVPALRAEDYYSNTPISFLHRLLWVVLPRRVRQADGFLTGGRLGSSCYGWGGYLMHEKHPTIVAFFLTLLAVSEYFFLPVAWPQVASVHHVLMPVACAIPYLMLYLCVWSDPGFITPQNLRESITRYPYDHVLFRPGIRCSTCQLLKPARSKHCRICKRCISKSDHHCIWVNNCVGYGNYHYFLLLLLSTGLLMNYAAYVGHQLMDSAIQKEHVLIMAAESAQSPAKDFAHWSMGLNWSDYFNTWMWALSQDVGLGAVSLLCFLCAPLAHGLLIYHLYLIWAGMTTNESAKWSDTKEDIADGLVYKSTRALLRSTPSNDTRWSNGGPENPEDLEPPLPVPWPVTSNQVLHFELDVHRPGVAPGSGLDHKIWTPVRSLEEVVNIYDIGFGENLRDAFRLRRRGSAV